MGINIVNKTTKKERRIYSNKERKKDLFKQRKKEGFIQSWQMNEWMNERTNERVNEWMNEWMNECTDFLILESCILDKQNSSWS